MHITLLLKAMQNAAATKSHHRDRDQAPERAHVTLLQYNRERNMSPHMEGGSIVGPCKGH